MKKQYPIFIFLFALAILGLTAVQGKNHNRSPCRRAAKVAQKPIRRSLPVSESWEILCKKGVDPKYEKQWEGPCDKEIKAIYDHSVEKLKEKGQLDTLLGLHHDHEKMTDFIKAFGAHYDNTDLDWFRGVVPSGKVPELKACLRGYLGESFHKLA